MHKTPSTSGVFSKIAGLAKLAEYFAQLVWPVCCPLCGRLGRVACLDCMRALAWEMPSLCMTCARHAPCSHHPDAPLCSAASWYELGNRDLIHAMKYRGARQIARMMGTILAERTPRPDADFLVPVPLHRGSERGYNQAELIANAASLVWKIPVRSLLFWNADTVRQARASNLDERKLRKDAIMSQAIDAGTRVFIVDDVYTTGNTLYAARRAFDARQCDVVGAMVWSLSKGNV